MSGLSRKFDPSRVHEIDTTGVGGGAGALLLRHLRRRGLIK